LFARRGAGCTGENVAVPAALHPLTAGLHPLTAILHPATGTAAAVPTGPGYDVLLLAHVACAAVALTTMAAGGAFAWRLAALAPGEEPGEALRRYYAPGANWAGRTLYGVPVFGFVLLARSHGASSLGDGWVMAGLLLWVLIAAGAEGLLWPAERRLRGWLAGTAGTGAAPDPGGGATPAPRECRTVVTASAGLTAAMVAATVLMVAQP
jgi:uncharacterized membrane protein